MCMPYGQSQWQRNFWRPLGPGAAPPGFDISREAPRKPKAIERDLLILFLPLFIRDRKGNWNKRSCFCACYCSPFLGSADDALPYM